MVIMAIRLTGPLTIVIKTTHQEGVLMLRLFADLKFRWKLALPILLLAILLMLMAVLAIRGIDQLVEASTQLTKRSLPAVSLLLNADRDLYQAFIAERRDRKSTRLNSSHVKISYAVFCLKKKT